MEEYNTDGNIVKYFGQSYKIKNINEGDKIPIGGNIFNNDLSIYTVADFKYFKNFFENIQKNLNQIPDKNKQVFNFNQIIEYLKSNYLIKINENIFIKLLIFTSNLIKEYPIIKSGRQQLYKENNNITMLSDVFKNENAVCAERSILTQKFLQDNKIESSLFSGEVLWDENYEFSEKHTFIILNIKNEFYIFDPTNPDGWLPSIYKINGDFSTMSKYFKLKNYILLNMRLN